MSADNNEIERPTTDKRFSFLRVLRGSPLTLPLVLGLTMGPFSYAAVLTLGANAIRDARVADIKANHEIRLANVNTDLLIAKERTKIIDIMGTAAKAYPDHRIVFEEPCNIPVIEPNFYSPPRMANLPATSDPK